MLTIDLIIGIILVLVGLSVFLYILYILTHQKQVKVSLLYISEALATLLLGVFYVTCACLVSTISISTNLTHEEGSTISPLSSSTSSAASLPLHRFYTPTEEKNLRDLYDPDNFYNNGSTTAFAVDNVDNSTNYDDTDEQSNGNDELINAFVNYYKETFANQSRLQFDNEAINKLANANRLQRNLVASKHVKSKQSQQPNEENEAGTAELEDEEVTDESEDCKEYDEVYYKYMMLVVGFIYGIMSMINSTIECQTCTMQQGHATDNVSNSGGKIFIKKKTSDHDRESAGDSGENVEDFDDNVDQQRKVNCKSIVQVLLAWFLPVIYAVIVTITMKPSSQLIVTIIANVTPLESPSDIVNIIMHPLNVTIANNANSTQQDQEDMEAVIEQIYDIVHQKMLDAEPIPEVEINETFPIDILSIVNQVEEAKAMRSTRSEGRQVREEIAIGRKIKTRKCSLEIMPVKVHTLILFILTYALSMFYAKLTQTKLSLTLGDHEQKQEQVKILGKYIMASASLWLPSMLEIFSRTYLMETGTSVATDLTLALGNLTRLLANGINVRNLRKSLRKFNNVQPLGAGPSKSSQSQGGKECV